MGRRWPTDRPTPTPTPTDMWVGGGRPTDPRWRALSVRGRIICHVPFGNETIGGGFEACGLGLHSWQQTIGRRARCGSGGGRCSLHQPSWAAPMRPPIATALVALVVLGSILEKEKAREAGRETRSNKKQKVEPASASSVTLVFRVRPSVASSEQHPTARALLHEHRGRRPSPNDRREEEQVVDGPSLSEVKRLVCV